jgi:tetratricopeptide (TPR) repeat protein
MLYAIGSLLRLPGRTWLTARRHPRLTLLLVFGLVLGTGFGLWRFAVYQWRAARAALEADQFQEARDRLDYCLIAWPRSVDVHLLAARAARLTGDLDAAESHLNRCLKLHDGATDGVQIEFLLLRVQTGEVDAVAPVLFDTVEKGHPESRLILETLARSYILRLRYRMAYACLTKWIEIRPESARPYASRGWVLERLNNHKAGMADYRKALELDPDLVPVRLRVAEMLMEDKQAPEALPHLERLIRQEPDNPQVKGRLGMCRLLQGRTDEARTLMESAVVHMPKDPALLVALANLDLQEGRGPEAERRVRTVLVEDPSDTEALYVLASVLQFQGRTEEAAAVRKDYDRKRALVDRINALLKDVVDSPTARADDYAEIGRMLLEVGRDKVGTYWLDRALEKDPQNETAHRALATYYDRKGDAARAASHRRNVREPAPATPARPNS